MIANYHYFIKLLISVSLLLIILNSCTTKSDTKKITPYIESSDCAIFDDIINKDSALYLKSLNGSIDYLENQPDETNPATNTPCEQLRLAIEKSSSVADFEDNIMATDLFKDFMENSENASLHDKQLGKLLYELTKLRIKIRWKLYNRESELKKKIAENTQLKQKISELENKIKQLKLIESDINEKEQSIIQPAVERPGGKEPSAETTPESTIESGPETAPETAPETTPETDSGSAIEPATESADTEQNTTR